ncbi:TPA: hypothetical protein N0F65_006601 [Lagenidium giganteum]|uniref:Uncharacterized protein n=1 Tax=Lagenidium giganteum TaxID=4803 RepID=A0AAV2Z929_9STRA|nr:TPA: hypothetical protein N0F65_006601 [Lagenidium giganteum]
MLEDNLPQTMAKLSLNCQFYFLQDIAPAPPT